MKKYSRNFAVLGAVAILCAAIICVVVNSTRGQEQGYGFENEITLPEYHSNIDKMIDAYERMFDRLMYAMGSGAGYNAADVNSLSRKLSDLDSKLTMINTRLARIENAIGSQKQSKELKQLCSEANDINDTTNITKTME